MAVERAPGRTRIDRSAVRVVIGRTGRSRDVIGEVHAENIGENRLGFCNFRVTFKLRKVEEVRGH